MPDSASKKKEFLTFSLKFIFSFSILIYIFAKVAPVNMILQVIKKANILWLLASFSLHALGIFISAYRWQILIHAQGDRVPLGFLAKSYLVGNFFNNFLPTRFGGDIVRIWDGSRYSRSLLKSSAIVLVERLTGVIVLLAFAFGASFYRLDMAQSIPVIWVSLSIGLIGLLCIMAFFSPFTNTALKWIPDKGPLHKIKNKILEFKNVVLVYKKQKKPLLKATFWALLLQINVILHYYFAGKALHLHISFFDYFIFIPIILIILIIPITISGLGLREIIYIEIFKFYGITQAAAVSFPLVADVAFTLIIGIIGGIIYATRK